MKQLWTIFLFLCVTQLALAQTAQTNRINYQAVARKADGSPIAEGSSITMRITILEGSATGTSVYSETKSIQTAKYGLFKHSIGDGSPVGTSNFNAISWGSKKWLKVEIDPLGGSAYVEVSNEEMKAVPFANVAATANTAISANTATTAINATNAVTATNVLNLPNPINQSLKINGNGGATFTLNETTASMTRIRWSQTNNAKYWDMASYPSITAEHFPSVLDFWYWNGSSGSSQFQLRGNGKGGFGITDDKQYIGRVNIVNDDDYVTNPSLTIQTARPNDFTRVRFLSTARPTKLWDMATITGATPADARYNFWYSDNAGTGRDILSISGDGKVGIGTGPSTGLLTIENFDEYAKPTMMLRSSNSGLFTRLRFTNTGFSNRWWDIVTVANGNPDGRLIFHFNNGTTNKDLFTFDFAGNAYASGSFINASDERLKKNITPLSRSLPILMQLSGYHYNWKDETADASLQLGFLAQEVEKYFPELVKTNDKGMKGINYIGLIPVVVTAMKEQQKSIETLQKTMEMLQKEIEELKNKK
jgi:Chaperone of endosialidase